MKATRPIEGELFIVPEKVIHIHIDNLHNELLKKREKVQKMNVLPQAHVEAEVKTFWDTTKKTATEIVRPVWEKRDEIIYTIATKLIHSWLQRQLEKNK